MKNKLYLLALNRITGIGPRITAKLLKRWPALDEMFALSSQELIESGLPAQLAHNISAFDMRQVDADLHWQDAAPQNHLITWADKAYPALLKEIHDPPPVIYAIGDLAAFAQPTVAMVGTRKPSVTGSETAWQFARDLSQAGVTVVSGLALGIDAAAHSGCLTEKGRTIAVMGTGVDRVYPFRHQALAKKIADNGLLISEFPLKTSPSAGHFPRRNRIISGLSLITLVVEAAVKSGSLITARLALEQNRDVLAIPGSILNPQARGCHSLLQQGAKLVSSVQDVLDELSIPVMPMRREESHVEVAMEGKNLVQCIGFEVTSVDQIIERSGFSVNHVVCDLAELELQGMVQSVPGGYMRCR